MEFAAEAGHQLPCCFFRTGPAQDRDEPGALAFDLVAEVRPGRQRRVAGSPALLLLHPPKSSCDGWGHAARVPWVSAARSGERWVGPRREGSLGERSEVRVVVG